LNTTGWHAPAVFLNLASQTLQAAIASDAGSTGKITTSVHPFSLTNQQKTSSNITFTVVALFFIIAFSVVPATFISFVVMENRTKAKHLQVVSGISAPAYWISTFVFDYLSYSIPMLASWIILVAFGIDGLIGENFVGTAVVFILFGLAITPMTYAFSFYFKDEAKALIFTVIAYFFSGFILFLADMLLALIQSTQDVEKSLKYIFAVVPEFTFARALYDINLNSMLMDCGDAITKDSNEALWEQVCKKDIFDSHVAGTWVTFLAAEFVVFTTLVIFIEWSKQGGCLSRVFHRSPQVDDEPYEEDEDLVKEQQRITSGAADDDIVWVKDLRKVYPGRGNVGPKVAVKKLSFGVPAGEVFGFLGINGAGKTTTLSILSGEFPATAGEARLAGLDMYRSRPQINQQMGYCPQFDAVLAKLTGREHLEMFARIKGINESEISGVVEDCIDKMNLREHCEREAGSYSGGNKRKLSVAIALVGNPKIVFLDEPSTGMDPEARRFMWNVIASTMKGRSVILTTHSMEEAEALSTRIGIMVGGRLRCLGTTQHLKTKYGAGYTLELSSMEAVADAVEAWVADTFPGSSLVEKHGGQLRYEIGRSESRLSVMFSKLEESRERLGITDYALSQTTLEKVFLKFAAEQEEETNLAPGLNGDDPPAARRSTPQRV